MRKFIILLVLGSIGCEVEVGVEGENDAALTVEDASPTVDKGATIEADQGVVVPDQGIIAPDQGVEQVMCHEPADCEVLESPIYCRGAWHCDPDEAEPADHRGPGGCAYVCDLVEGCVDDNDCGVGEYCAICGPDADCDALSECLPVEICETDDECMQLPAPIQCPGHWYCDPQEMSAPDHSEMNGCVYTCDDPLIGCLDDADCEAGEYCELNGPERVCLPIPPLCLEDAQCEGRGAPIWCEGTWACAADMMVEADFYDIDGCAYTCEPDVGVPCDVDEDCGPGARCVPCEDPACQGRGICEETPEGCREDADCAQHEHCEFCDGPDCDLGVCVPDGVEPWVCHDVNDCAGQDAPLRCLGEWSCDPEGLMPADFRGEGGCIYNCGISTPCETPRDCAEGEICLEGLCVPDAPWMCGGAEDCADRPAPIRCVGEWGCDPEETHLADYRDPDGCVYNCAEVCGDGPPCAEGEICVDGSCVEAPPAMCEAHEECLDHNPPIRCEGVWRCDPQHRNPADARGEDGCDYTCEFNLRPCNVDEECPPSDYCAPCEGEGCVARGQCTPGARVGICQETVECFDHTAPIRCPGVWRCDPEHQSMATARGEDGCDYTCVGQLIPCREDAECMGDVCAPCPIEGTCAAPTVCQPPEEARRCDDLNLSRCEGLAHDACVGGWTCLASQCAWECDGDQDRPTPQMNTCQEGDPMMGCCAHEECEGGFCQAVGYDAQDAYCGGMAPPPENECVRDQCEQDVDCGEAEVCVLAGAHGYVLNTCVRAVCQEDRHCGGEGVCLPFFRPCNSYGFACVYPADPCRVDADCPQERFPMLCLPNADGRGTRCVEDIPRP